MNQVSDVNDCGDFWPMVMDGVVPAGHMRESVGGRLLVTDSRGLLREIATACDDRSAWLARLLWLVDGADDPALPRLDDGKNVVSLPKLHGRFRNAVLRCFAERLNHQESGPVVYQRNFAHIQIRWLAFLEEMEKRLPGVTGLARRLPATLIFGLRQLVTTNQIPEGFSYTCRGVEALARLLVLRTTNHRSALFFSDEEARNLKNKRRILNKLEQEGLKARAIYRALHLDAGFCRELLEEMEGENLVEPHQGQWTRIPGKSLSANQNEHLQLEV